MVMSYEEHLARNRVGDGFNAAAAQQDLAAELAAEIEADPGRIQNIANKAAASERHRFEARNRDNLKKQWGARQGVLSLDLSALVPLGDNAFVPLGEMHGHQIRIRKDMRTKTHLDENEAYREEMEFWMHWESLLNPNESIGDL